MQYLIDFINWGIDALLLWMLFRKIQTPSEISINRKISAWAILCLSLPVYILTSGIFSSVVFRYIVRHVIYAVWLVLLKGIRLPAAIYMGGLAWIAYTISDCVFLTPPLIVLRRDQAFYAANSFTTILIGRFGKYLLTLLIILIFSYFVDFEKIHRIRFERIIIIGSLIISELYIKNSLHALAGRYQDHYDIELTVYPILVQLLIIIIPISFEHYFKYRQEREQETLQATIMQRDYNYAVAQHQAGEDLRQLHHDIKNHLLALSAMLGEENSKAESYIEQLIGRMEPYELQPNTGNKMLDGLISEKMRLAKSKNIDFGCNLDFRKGSFIADMDICTIFGNAIDNALEASSMVQDMEKRFIIIKSTVQSGQLLLSFTNYFEGKLSERGNLPVSSKKQPGHGIGISSIKTAAEKYNGIVTYSVDEYHDFILTVMLPLPEA